MTSSTSDSVPILVGDRIVLRGPKEADLDALLEIRNDVPLQKQLMARPKPNSRDDVRAWLSRRREAKDAVFFVIADKSSDRACGFIQFLDMSEMDLHGRLGIAVSAEWRARGVGAEALALLDAYLRKFHRMRKIVLEVLASNVRAIDFYRRLGFAEVGTLRGHHFADGVFLDVMIMERPTGE